MFVLISYPSSKSINILHLNILSLSVAAEIEPMILWSLDNGSHMWHSTSKSINIFLVFDLIGTCSIWNQPPSKDHDLDGSMIALMPLANL